MLSILCVFCDRSETEYVFTRGGNTGPKFYRILREACESCGITYGRNVEGGIVFHDTRHTATTRMLHARLDLATIQSVTGHTDKTMGIYYSHSSPETSARAAEVLEKYAGDGVTDAEPAKHLRKSSSAFLINYLKKGK
jgi:integrase